jgi:hypothetical protein
MSARDDLERKIGDYVEETYGESWPTVAYVVYARVTDPESMTVDQPVWIIPDGQRSFVTRGLLEEALSEHESDNLPVFTFAEVDDDGDDEF